MAREVTEQDIIMIDGMVARAQKAAAVIETYDQERVDRLCQAVAAALYDLGTWAPLCDEAVDETGLGDKVTKRNKRNKKNKKNNNNQRTCKGRTKILFKGYHRK